MSSSKVDPVLDSSLGEDVVLERLGYAQELKRSIGLLGMIGFSFCIVNSWAALSGVLVLGIASGGPPVMIYSWIGICVVTLTVAFSMAEICSAYPVSGGQYSWVAVLAPKSVARGMSWTTGWFMITGLVAMAAVSNFIVANFILGQVKLTNPYYTIERWHTVLVAYLVALTTATVNVYVPHLLDRISKAMVVWNVLTFVTMIIVILACNDHKQPTSFVFRDFQNLTGFDPAFTAILGLLQSAFGMCCYEAPAHMTEEMTHASREAPRSIIISVLLGAITGLIFLISASFCIGDFASTAATPTGVPLIQIFFDSTGSVAASCVLASMLVVVFLSATVFLTAEGSRSLFAFARDRGLPFSRSFVKVDARRQVPMPAILLGCAVQMVLNSIYFGTVTGFNTIIAVSTEGFYLSYAMPLAARILSALTQNSPPPLLGPYTLGRYSLPLNAVGLIFLLFLSITFNFPGTKPVSPDNMNYTSAAIGIIGLVSLVTWLVDGRRNFTGPTRDLEKVRNAHAMLGIVDRDGGEMRVEKEGKDGIESLGKEVKAM